MVRHNEVVKDSGIRKKKMRKGTHSCFECRRRKIKCIYATNPNGASTLENVCTECFARGSRCYEQALADPEVVVDQRKNLRERVAHLESLVESLLEEKSGRRTTETLRDLASDHLPPTPSSGDIQYGANERVPFLGLFNNAVWTRAEKNYTARSGSELESPMDHDSRSTTDSVGDNRAHGLHSGFSDQPSRAEKSERICQTLANAIPSQEKLEEAVRTNKGWWGALRGRVLGLSATPEQLSLESFVSHALSRGTPTQMAKVLQLVARTVDEEHLERILLLIERLVLVDDEYMGTMEGLECAYLQGNLYSDIGQARRAWLTYRRAMTFAEICGLHRQRVNTWQDMLWWGLYAADRFSSLIIGAPYSVPDSHCSLTFGGKKLPSEPSTLTTICFVSRLAIMSGKVIDRTHATKESSYSSLLELDNEMTRLGAKMPNDYWEVSDLAPLDPAGARKWQRKAIGSISYYQLKLILHMPYMLKSVDNAEYTFSRDCCFESARNLIRTYQKIRAEANQHCYKVKSIDFIAFMAAIALLLKLLGYGHMTNDPKQRDYDWKLIESSMDTFLRVSDKLYGKVAAQSYRALVQLTQFRHTRSARDQDSETKIMIPFFGTISVRRGQGLPVSSSPPEHVLPSSGNIGAGINPRMPSWQSPSTYQPMDPQIAYDGVYMQATTCQRQDPASIAESFSGYIPPSLQWQNIGNFDLDQDWGWLVTDMQAPQLPLHA